jgi:hypothetical protein
MNGARLRSGLRWAKDAASNPGLLPDYYAVFAERLVRFLQRTDAESLRVKGA